MFDFRSREIPDWLSVALLTVALISTGFQFHRVGWLNLAEGLALGFGIGFGLFALGGFGGGDVKLLASLGAVLGWKSELGVMFYVALFGSAMALIAKVRGQREFAYAPAMALGLLTFIAVGYFR